MRPVMDMDLPVEMTILVSLMDPQNQVRVDTTTMTTPMVLQELDMDLLKVTIILVLLMVLQLCNRDWIMWLLFWTLGILSIRRKTRLFVGYKSCFIRTLNSNPSPSPRGTITPTIMIMFISYWSLCVLLV